MKKILLTFATVWITVSGFAQLALNTADIGIWGGTSSYFGDMRETNPFQSFNPTFGAYFRQNINPRWAFRGMFLYSNNKESGVIEGVPWSYNKSVQDLSLQVEVNYLKYILGERSTPFTSYLTAGLGVAFFPYHMDPDLIASFNPDHNKGNAVIDDSDFATTLPFGIGFKYNIGYRLGIGIEYQMRKLLSDKLDDLDDPLAHFNSEGEQVTYTTSMHNNDWLAFLGVHITYSIYKGEKACPVYDRKIK